VCPEMSPGGGMATAAELITRAIGPHIAVPIQCYDGSTLGPPAGAPDAAAIIAVRSPAALRRLVTASLDLGLARAYVAGELDVDGDIFEALKITDATVPTRPRSSQLAAAAGLIRAGGWRQAPPPPEEIAIRGRLHSKARDAAAISHHYDVSNRFYELVLGPSLTYSCAVFETPSDSLEAAQRNKLELVCRKLGLRPGMRLLDVGCGWGSLVLHAARHHGVTAVGVTISAAQAEAATARVCAAGLSDQIEIRLQDYREIDDGPFDAISSIGMFEHVGLSQLDVYFRRLHALLRPAGRLLNHGIARSDSATGPVDRNGFMHRYVFPDGELHEVGAVVSAVQAAGFEARHVEGLREHYALTLRKWVSNLERNWDEAVAETSPGRARVWRLYMAGCALGFEAGDLQIHQVLATRNDGGRSGMGLRPEWTAGPVEIIDLRSQGTAQVGRLPADRETDRDRRAITP
jgi:cyclopropane-fatty-acyl-phospholipid synthase